ncbi:MAPEG family protein [Thalassotalea profundi]|uniref:Membrane protein n=1 Tax=Thalassotalea profundi TaxID=2036687 RepID=A0ABQ3IXE9_9GAMM|nr:MAPEG family protein [Thalassotalea profundi]GHE92182.1 membrane protein [Thalassotalea profundi]
MATLIWCLFISILLPMLSKGPVGYAQNKLGRYDNKNPRSQQATLTGFGARALAAHQNAFEALIMFAPAILLAIATNNTGKIIEQLAVVHIISRLCYHILYLLNWSTLRSIVWFIGLGTTLAIVIQCLPV